MQAKSTSSLGKMFKRYGFSMQTKLIAIFLLAKIIPLILLCLVAWRQFMILGDTLRKIAVDDATHSLNHRAVENIERLSTDTARAVAEFLYRRDADLLYVASMTPDDAGYAAFITNARKRVIKQGDWELAADGNSWVNMNPGQAKPAGVSTNPENDDMEGFHAIPAEPYTFTSIPLYDEITFIDPNGMELFKAVSPDSPKKRTPLNPEKRDVSKRENTFVKAETYFDKLKKLKPGEIFVSDVIGEYTGSNFIGMYTRSNLAKASEQRGYSIEYDPEAQAYAGRENPLGRRFEGIVRFATPVAGKDGSVVGYVTLALNHDHIMEFVDHITPMDERYIELPSAYEGNYAFIWDYNCRSICHPRHHSIVGFDKETGDPQVPWLEESIYKDWLNSGAEKWMDFVKDIPVFHNQSRSMRPAPELTREGLIGLDGRWLNNAPQCTGWMDLTVNGGSGSFYILWSGLYKLNTAAAIPYYTGQYAPSEENGFSRRGFGFVAIGSELDFFTQPAKDIEAKLTTSIDENLGKTVMQLIIITFILTVAVILVALWMAWHISSPIKRMAKHMSRLSTGDIFSDEQEAGDQKRYDEIGLLARSLNDLTQSRREELQMVNAIAAGDYTRSIPLRSDRDMLGKSLNAMVQINKNALSQVSEAVVQVGDGANSMAMVSDSVSRGVRTSEDVLKDISDTVASVGQQVQKNATDARDANQLAVASRDAAQRGYDAVSELASSMTLIQQSGAKIATVVKLIDDIAFQTNLLALNAAVEAARAGRQGKGFTVVAEEVRNLAARSAKAAHETGEMVESMLTLMENGSKMADHSDKEFREIVDIATQVAHVFKSIADASDVQSSAVSQIGDSLGQIDQVVQQNSENSHQMSRSASELSRQAEDLRQMVSHFRLGTSTKVRRKLEKMEKQERVRRSADRGLIGLQDRDHLPK